MKEYRVCATFKDVYKSRTYKGVVTPSLERAKELLEAAEVYYNLPPYDKHFENVEIQSREVTEWKRE